MKVNWTEFFISSIKAIKRDLAIVARDASGCREGWLQAQLFLAAKKRKIDLRVNEHRISKGATADLSYGGKNPSMIAEVKIVAAHFQTKMQQAVEADLRRLRAIRTRPLELYMILVIPDSQKEGKLRKYLDSWPPKGKCKEIPSDGNGFCLKLLRLR